MLFSRTYGLFGRETLPGVYNLFLVFYNLFLVFFRLVRLSQSGALQNWIPPGNV